MTREDMRQRLELALSPERYAHSLAVEQAAAELARRYGQDVDQAVLAGLLHDCAKYMTGAQMLAAARDYGLPIDRWEEGQPALLHAKVGACLARAEYGVRDEEVLRAIERHIYGVPGMGELDLLVNLADYVAQGRDYPGVEEVRDLAMENPRAALALALRASMVHILKDKGTPLHPGIVATYNDLLENNPSQGREKGL